jgi:stress-induced morphogen
MQTEIEKNLRDRFAPSHIQVINESHMHSVPKNSETHFKVVVVSDAFDSVQLVARHRMVNDCLKEQLQQGVHALSIVTKTPAQWQTMVEQGKDAVEASPKCQGGNKL